MGFLDSIKSEWTTVRGAPWSVAALVGASLFGGFTVGQGQMKQQLANAESLVKLKDGQIDEYQKATNARLDKVEKILSARQLSSLELGLKAAPSKVIISADPSISKIYTKQFEDVFKNSGWQVDTKSIYSSLGDKSDYSPDTFTLETKDAIGATIVSKALSEAGVKFTKMTSEIQGAMKFQLDK